MATFNLDAELTLLLYRLSPVSLRVIMAAIARYLDDKNAQRIRSQINGDGTAYAPRRNGTNRPMLNRYANRIRQRVESNQSVIGIFGRMGKFGAVHDSGKTERGIRYPRRNLLTLPAADKLAVLDMLKRHIGAFA